MAKCPRGYVCLSDRWGLLLFVTIIVILVTIGIIYIFYPQTPNELIYSIKKLIETQHNHNNIIVEQKPNINGFGNDIHTNPYIPPFKPAQPGLRGFSDIRNYDHNRDILFERQYPRNAINIPTRRETVIPPSLLGVITTTKEGKQTVMPLYGRPIDSNRNKFEYYTKSDGYNSYKLSVVNEKDCMNRYGCKEIMEDQDVKVKGYEEDFKVHLYNDEDPARHGVKYL
jgi:hypothetical protein